MRLFKLGIVFCLNDAIFLILFFGSSQIASHGSIWIEHG